ncbi:MAG: hypothetical protein SVY53_07660 [Chloroflexota bacterium]|nr:hypothetical protein [Chloroflexota bacterium]
MRNCMKLLGLIAILAAVLATTSIPAAADSPYCYFSGMVTIDGTPAPEGTIVAAWVDGAGPFSTTTRKHGEQTCYSLAIPADKCAPSDKVGAVRGDEVQFSINDVIVDKTARWRIEAHYGINLNVGSDNTNTQLFAGWNKVNYRGPDQSPIDAVASIADSIQAIWQYNNEIQQWQIWVPTIPGWVNNLSDLEQTQIYYVKVSEDCIWST